MREEAPGLGNLVEDFDFSQAPRPPLLLPVDPAPGPASCPPGSVPSKPGSPCGGQAAPSPTQPPASTPPAPVLQLTASVARRQDMRLRHGRIYLTVGCNEACSIYAHGHLNLRRGRRHLGLRGVRATLAADRTVRIALSLSRRNLSAVHRALREHRSVKAAIVVQAIGAADGGLPRAERTGRGGRSGNQARCSQAASSSRRSRASTLRYAPPLSDSTSASDKSASP